MCGRFQIEPSPKLDALIESIGAQGEIHYAQDIASGATILIIYGWGINTADLVAIQRIITNITYCLASKVFS